MNPTSSQAIEIARHPVRGLHGWPSITALAGLLLLGSVDAARAQTTVDSYRCRNDLVSVGDTMKAVRAGCGEPATRDQVCERNRPGEDGGPAPCLNVERWTYRPGYGQFVTIMVFDEDGMLVEIRYGDRM